MLRLHNVGVRFDYFWLRHISFQLPPGYIMGLVGPNGSGKTTLIKVLLGLFEKTQGEITIFDCIMPKEEKEIRDQIGVVLADHYFIKEWTMKRNARRFGAYYSKFSEEKFMAYCKEFSIHPEKKVEESSKGEVMKFQLAFALAIEPQLLILDEPTANFDAAFRGKMLGIMTKFVEDGAHSILISTHITTELDQIADYITFLDKGRMLFSMDREELYESYQLVSGPKEAVEGLGKEVIIYKEIGTYQTKALVKALEVDTFSNQLLVENPTIEDMMYYMVKRRRQDEKGAY